MDTKNIRVRAGTIIAATGLLLVGSVTGATAGSLITGKQIKNSSVTGKDIKDGSLSGGDVAGGSIGLGNLDPAIVAKLGSVPAGTLRELTSHDFAVDVVAGDPGFVSGPCPAGKVVVSGAAWWVDSMAPVQTVFPGTGVPVAIEAWAAPIGDDDTLILSVICGRTA